MSNNLLKSLDVLRPFTADIHKRTHGRALAKSLDLSQKTVQNRLNYLEQEGILESDISGRTKQFKLRLESLLARKSIIMAEMLKLYQALAANFELKEIVEDVLAETEAHVLVYGSFARGDYDQDSDLDLLLIGGSEADLNEISDKYSRSLHVMEISEKEFKQGLETGSSYLKEILTHHLICQGCEAITSWRFKHE